MLFSIWVLIATVCAYICDSNALHFIVDISAVVVSIFKELPNAIEQIKKFFSKIHK